jgi:predicted RNA-binding protein with TRAM domain
MKENQEIEVVVDDIESRGESVTGIQDYLTFVPGRKRGERGRVRIRGVSEKSALAERTI